MNVRWPSTQTLCTTEWERYVASGDKGIIGLTLWAPDEDGHPELYGIASVNPPSWPAAIDAKTHIAVKNWSENAGMVEELIKAGVIEPAIEAIVPSGFVEIQIHRLTPAALEEISKSKAFHHG